MGGNFDYAIAIMKKVGPAVLCVAVDDLGLSLIVPSLPYHLEDNGVDVGKFYGLIITVQFISVSIGSFFWGVIADKYGSKISLQGAMFFDTLFFTLTAFFSNPWLLLLCRLGSGFSSPIVSAITYAFDVCGEDEVVVAVTIITTASTMAYIVGGAVVGALYTTLKWLGINIMAGGFAAFAFSMASLAAKPPKIETTEKTDASAAIKTKQFATIILSSVLFGWANNAMYTSCVLHFFVYFDFTIAQVGYVLTGIPIFLTICGMFAPLAAKKAGEVGCVVLAHVLLCVTSGLLALPFINESIPLFLIVKICTWVAITVPVPANTGRIKTLAVEKIPSGDTGLLNGVVGTAITLGRGLSPVLSTTLYDIDKWMPFALICLLCTLCIASYKVLGIKNSAFTGGH